MSHPGITGFGHIDLTVTDVDRTVAWWERVLGFTLINTTATRPTSSSAMRSSSAPG